MADVKFSCVLSCTSDAHLFINGNEIDLDESGADKSCEVTVPAGSQMHIHATLEGVELSKWSITITPSCPASQPKALWTRSDVFKKGAGGGIILNGDATVPDDPCSSNDGLRLMRLTMPTSTAAITPEKAYVKPKKTPGKKGAKTHVSAISFLLLASSSCLFGQQSLFESGDGRTSLYIQHTSVGINLGDSKASFGYIHNHSKNKVFYGAGLYATASSGTATLFSSDKAKAPEGGFDGVIGFRKDIIPDCQTAECSFRTKNNRLLLDGGYGRSTFYLYPTGTVASTNTNKTSFDRFRALGGWNGFYNGKIVFGLVAGVERRNNTGDLKSANLAETLVAAPTGGSVSVVHEQAGFYGDYKVYVAAPIYEDFLVYLPAAPKWLGDNNRIGIDFLSRADGGSANRGALGGVGLYLFNGKDPFKTIGGISATYDGKKVQFSLTAGFSGKS